MQPLIPAVSTEANSMSTGLYQLGGERNHNPAKKLNSILNFFLQFFLAQFFFACFLLFFVCFFFVFLNPVNWCTLRFLSKGQGCIN